MMNFIYRHKVFTGCLAFCGGIGLIVARMNEPWIGLGVFGITIGICLLIGASLSE